MRSVTASLLISTPTHSQSSVLSCLSCPVTRTEDGVKKEVVVQPDDDHTYCDFLEVYPDLIQWAPTDIDY